MTASKICRKTALGNWIAISTYTEGKTTYRKFIGPYNTKKCAAAGVRKAKRNYPANATYEILRRCQVSEKFLGAK